MIAPNDKNNQEPADEMSFEPEEGLGDVDALKAKLKKLKDELETVKKERAEYLDGWQRCKADAINSRREATVNAWRVSNLLRDSLLEDVIPALDSFDVAMASDSWAKMEGNWRTGMENVYSQLITALRNQGVQIFGQTGEQFDANMHEAVQEIEMDGVSGSIAKVLRKGYLLTSQSDGGERVLRPAQVAIVKAKQTEKS